MIWTYMRDYKGFKYFLDIVLNMRQNEKKLQSAYYEVRHAMPRSNA